MRAKINRKQNMNSPFQTNATITFSIFFTVMCTTCIILQLGYKHLMISTHMWFKNLLKELCKNRIRY